MTMVTHSTRTCDRSSAAEEQVSGAPVLWVEAWNTSTNGTGALCVAGGLCQPRIQDRRLPWLARMPPMNM